MLIDRQLPRPDVREVHELVVRATPFELAPLIDEPDLSGSRLVRILFALRGLPRESLRLAGMERVGFVVVDRAPEKEIVLGLIGRFWRLRDRPLRFEAGDFARFDRPGYARAAWNFTLVPRADDTTLLRTETRVQCTDAASRRAFLRYWRVIRPFSGLIRMEALRGMRDVAEGRAR